MLEIESVIFRGFLGYGDYDTHIKLDNLGTTLITGDIEGSSQDEDESNSAGKSTIINAIIWCLFGRTMHKANPGDKVINWFIDPRTCRVELILKNGDRIIRVRNGRDGHDDLLYIENGVDQSLGTNKMQQEDLNRRLNLDCSIFCGSSFFTQYGKSWMEMSDQSRKKALEREFRIDRIQLYADVAREKYRAIEQEQEKIRIQINSYQLTINQLTGQVDDLMTASARFDTDKAAKVEAAQVTLKRLEESRDSIQVPDIDSLRSKWVAVEKIQKVLAQKLQEIYKLEGEQRTNASKLSYKKGFVAQWTAKNGKLCTECERPYDAEFVSSKTASPVQEIADLNARQTALEDEINTKQTKYREIEELVEAKKPDKTIQDAERDKREWQRRCSSVSEQQKVIDRILQEVNHYDDSIKKIQDRITTTQAAVDVLLTKLKKFDTLALHFNYIYKAYSDRRRIKKQILQDYIPYLNERINHYLDRFELRLRVQFSDGMAISSNYWDYDFFCGGERKRVDVAMMLAMLDLHTLMYGKQCNIIALDEVDGRLDPKGARILTDIVRNDLAEKVDSVLVVSHRFDMRGALSSEIKVRKEFDPVLKDEHGEPVPWCKVAEIIC